MNLQAGKYQNNIMKNRSHAQYLAAVLVLYVYLPFFVLIIDKTVSINVIYKYIIYSAIILYTMFRVKYINKYALIFLIFFLGTLVINMLLVPYTYYVLVEGIQALITMAIPIVIVSCKDFDISIFVNKWSWFAKRNLPLIILAIILFKEKIVNYSIFNEICIPNLFIYMFLLISAEIYNDKLNICLTAINVFTVILLGGRAAALTSVFLCVVALFFSNRISVTKKIILAHLIILFVIMVFLNFYSILIWINNLLSSIGINSRSIYLLLRQIQNGKLYVTNRDIIYSVCLDFIKKNWYLIGGFGVTLHLTNGQYYYPHNILLQMLVQFGIIGTISLLILMCVRFKMIKNRLLIMEKKYVLFSLLAFCVIGMTGSSIWLHYLSTIPVSIFFFYRTKGLNK
mgnify:CR=1 FL=1